MIKLTLYSTEHCTLCDRALDMLLAMGEVQGMQLEVVDIANSNELVARYGELIPVLACGDATLPAPFLEQDVKRWLSDHVD